MAMKQSTSPQSTRPGVERIPMGNQDRWRPVDNIRTIVFFIIQEVLDEKVLSNALDKLIREHLPILGARIESTGKDGALEYNLPKPFPKGYELFRWSSREMKSPFTYAEHLPQVDKAEGAVAWGQSNVPQLEAQWSPDNWTVERKYDGPDCPIVLVHLTKYTNATVITTNIPHSVCDQMGNGSFMRAWMQIVRGETPPKFLELPPDALDGPKGLSHKELSRKGTVRVSTKTEYYRAIASLVPELISQPLEDRRLMYLSAPFISGLRERLNEMLHDRDGDKAVTLTNGDIVNAVILKLGNLHRKTPKLVRLSGAVNARGRYHCLPKDQPYLHNALAYNNVKFPLSRDTSLLEIALHNRRSIEEALTEDYIGRCFAVAKARLDAGLMVLSVDPGATSLAMTNWCNAWRGLSFSSAVVGGGATHDSIDASTDDRTARDSAYVSGRDSPLASSEAVSTEVLPPSADLDADHPLIFGHSLERHIKIQRYNCQIMCKQLGGYWVDFACSKKNMALIDDLLRRDPLLKTL